MNRESSECDKLRADNERLQRIIDQHWEEGRERNADNERLRAALIHTRTFLKTYQRSNANWHNDRPTWDFIHTIMDPVIGEEPKP